MLYFNIVNILFNIFYKYKGLKCLFNNIIKCCNVLLGHTRTLIFVICPFIDTSVSVLQKRSP